ncbi:MAG: hypothetical protein OFPI_33300 [Osedax symbiont Rs2]|nr:MAG: hypothetical protein OFPI_33300 [Osedax symbiont Rs2]
MKQRINLLPLKPKQVRNWLSFKNLLTLLSVLFIGSSLAGFGMWLDTGNLQSQTTAFEVKNLSLQNNLMQLKSQQAARRVPRELEQQLSQMRQQVLAMQQMSEQIDDMDPTKRSGFSQTLAKLHDSIPAKAQLEAFKIGPQNHLVYLRGTARRAHDLPLIVKNLRAGQLLDNQNIEKLRTQRSGDAHSFELSITSGGQSL